MKRAIAVWLGVLIGAVSASAYAQSSLSRAFPDSDGTNPLVLVGPVEAIDAKTGTITVLGQRVHTRDAAVLTAGTTVGVYGVVLRSRSVVASSIVQGDLYVPGATQVVLTGQVEAVNSSLGRAKVAGLEVDLTPLMVHSTPDVLAGSTVQLTGTQPTNYGPVLVSGIIGGGVTQGILGGGVTQGIIGGGVAEGIIGGGVAQGIIGGGFTEGIIGGGVTQGIIGGGVTQGIIGGGVTQGIIGGGVSAQGIIGGGRANGIIGGGVTEGIIGGGVTQGIIGGGFATQGIIGGGVTTQGIIGGGVTQGIIGGGVTTQGIIGGGATVQGIIGGGIY